MKQLSNIVAVVGIVLVIATLYGRFHGGPSILGYSGKGLLVAANTLLLLSLVINNLKK